MSKNRFSNNAWDEITVASYNIHQCLGTDNRKDMERTIRVIVELDAQLVGLQEVHSSFIQSPQVDTLTQITGLNVIPGPTMHRSDGHYGNVLLTAFSPLAVQPIDLSFPGKEPRGAIDAELNIQGRSVRVIVTHLGLNAKERQFQVDLLSNSLISQKHDLLVLMGDFNEWFPFRRQLLLLNRLLGKIPTRPTYPSRYPILALDRIWLRPMEALRAIKIHRSPSARIASDHLPLKARIAVGARYGHRA
ncbi:MAG: endonuclease/exonuclease/phosphatase family protein [Deltaproteobacteria bacterium]|nr:endonuclease/exonuclease/phosphatase family protein [Deltaproteobacteria bacterium]